MTQVLGFFRIWWIVPFYALDAKPHEAGTRNWLRGKVSFVMSADILKAGIAGYGTVGKIRHRFANLHPNLRVTAVCDQAFTSPFTDSEGYRCWSNYEQLLS